MKQRLARWILRRFIEKEYAEPFGKYLDASHAAYSHKYSDLMLFLADTFIRTSIIPLENSPLPVARRVEPFIVRNKEGAKVTCTHVQSEEVALEIHISGFDIAFVDMLETSAGKFYPIQPQTMN